MVQVRAFVDLPVSLVTYGIGIKVLANPVFVRKEDLVERVEVVPVSRLHKLPVGCIDVLVIV
jgi:hypothetical protein